MEMQDDARRCACGYRHPLLDIIRFDERQPLLRLRQVVASRARKAMG
jgi:hypothetical protein